MEIFILFFFAEVFIALCTGASWPTKYVLNTDAKGFMRVKFEICRIRFRSRIIPCVRVKIVVGFLLTRLLRPRTFFTAAPFPPGGTGWTTAPAHPHEAADGGSSARGVCGGALHRPTRGRTMQD
jgi:hypothetical protein